MRPPHLGLRLPPKGGNHTLGCPWGVASLPLIIRVKDIHPWSPRNLKDPLYIRLYFLSPLLFFGSLSIRLSEGRVEEVKAQGEYFLMFNLVVKKKSCLHCDLSRLSITRPRTGIASGFVR